MIDRLITRTVNDTDNGEEVNVGTVTAVKQTVDMLTIALGRIYHPIRERHTIAYKHTDFIAMERLLLAYPNLLHKLLSGQASRVRKCISYANSIDAIRTAIFGRLCRNSHNGKERELAAPRATCAKHVVVSVGSPTGLKAARVATKRGHHVTLFEISGQLREALC
ncbi:NAD(P)/FAD-dependent oxidoreductase [Mycobacterium uberis]|uniref:NAD(P)/FAD-dependent oxidoreductase n=1 Tax=Mycobacterium uberis TaxID=2162698 RepID=UPI001FB29BF0|nr:FAD/NAD(P)-binding oxidoreductase [Mycobacterium uberis]